MKNLIQNRFLLTSIGVGVGICFFLALLSCLVFLVSPQAFAGMDIKGDFRTRGESHVNRDFNKAVGDTSRFASTRLRLSFEFSPASELDIFFQPQFANAWGQPDLVNAGTVTSATGVVTTTGSFARTSGDVRDPGLDVHQGYLKWRPLENNEVSIGRQTLSYGDELVIGKHDWDRVGRSFDAIKIHSRIAKRTWMDLFYAKIEDTNIGSAGSGDDDLAGLYFNVPMNQELVLDVYGFWTDDRNPPQTSLFSYGIRLKNQGDTIDYRLEGTAQKGISRYQYDAEVGVQLGSERLFLEYFSSHEDYNQLFPSGHEFLGNADRYSRRNITGAKAGWNTKISSELKATVSYHMFWRTKTDKPSYNISGAAIGRGSESGKPLSNEIDVNFDYELTKLVQLNVGGAYFIPRAYEQNVANSSSSGYFWYLQGSADF